MGRIANDPVFEFFGTFTEISKKKPAFFIPLNTEEANLCGIITQVVLLENVEYLRQLIDCDNVWSTSTIKIRENYG